MLRALRHLDDPQLQPLFRHLAGDRHPALKIHGILGLAETSPDPQLELARLADIEDPALAAQLVGAAMDADLLPGDQAQQVIRWPGMDASVRMVVATQLVSDGQFESMPLLTEALASENLYRRSLAALLLHQLGQPEGMAELRKLKDVEARLRHRVHSMVLSTAIEHDLERIGPWALDLAENPDVPYGLTLRALEAALRFKAPGAAQRWQQRLGSETDVAGRLRLGMTALAAAPWATPGSFAPLAADEDPLLAAIGTAASAASDPEAAGPAIVRLVETQYVPAIDWAVSWAREHASDPQRNQVLTAVISAFEPRPQRQLAQRLDQLVEAVRLLADHAPDHAAQQLKPRLSRENGDPVFKQGILLGLVRSHQPRVADILPDISPTDNPTITGLSIFLRARSGRELTPLQQQKFHLLIRGGGGFPETVRLQAAWIYLRRQGLADDALQKVIRT